MKIALPLFSRTKTANRTRPPFRISPGATDFRSSAPIRYSRVLFVSPRSSPSATFSAPSAFPASDPRPNNPSSPPSCDRKKRPCFHRRFGGNHHSRPKEQIRAVNSVGRCLKRGPKYNYILFFNIAMRYIIQSFNFIGVFHITFSTKVLTISI